MISFKVFSRLFHLQPSCLAAEKSLLANLRKKTGYTFSNCKKALEMHNNDLQQAELWLKQQAQTLGWSKATKLEGRQTLQGLVGVTVHNRNATLVEVNCETDFVSRNKEFQNIVEQVARTCLSFAEKQPESEAPLTKISLDADQLKLLKAEDGKSLADHLAIMIGTVGENATLRRAICLKAQSGVNLVGYAHPSGTQNQNVLLGRLGGIVALKETDGNAEDLHKVGKELCQHIVGMNPSKIGTENDEPSKDKESESCLIHQDFLLEDGVTVREILEEQHVEVIDFKRFECGEDLNIGKQVEFVETCQ